MKDPNDHIGNRASDLPACSAVLQPTASLRTPNETASSCETPLHLLNYKASDRGHAGAWFLHLTASYLKRRNPNTHRGACKLNLLVLSACLEIISSAVTTCKTLQSRPVTFNKQVLIFLIQSLLRVRTIMLPEVIIIPSLAENRWH